MGKVWVLADTIGPYDGRQITTGNPEIDPSRLSDHAEALEAACAALYGHVWPSDVSNMSEIVQAFLEAVAKEAR